MSNKTINISFKLLIALLALISAEALAHGVDDNTRNFLENNSGVQFFPFLYIGAKHMVTVSYPQ